MRWRSRRKTCRESRCRARWRSNSLGPPRETGQGPILRPVRLGATKAVTPEAVTPENSVGSGFPLAFRLGSRN